jgi:hypothetical protein
MRTRTTSIVRPPATTPWLCAVASPARTRSRSPGERARHHRRRRACAIVPHVAAAASKTNARFVLVEALAAKKRLFLNVRRERHVEALFGKNSCDINKRLNPF